MTPSRSELSVSTGILLQQSSEKYKSNTMITDVFKIVLFVYRRGVWVMEGGGGGSTQQCSLINVHTVN